MEFGQLSSDPTVTDIPLLFDDVLIGTIDRHILDRNFINITEFYPEPNPKWRYVDSAGHAHRWGRAKKLRWPGARVAVSGEQRWCDECEEDHPVNRYTIYACILCGEELHPGTRQPPSLSPLMTSKTVEVTVTFHDDNVIDELWRLTGREAQVEVIEDMVHRALGVGHITGWHRARDQAGECMIKITSDVPQ